MSWVVCIAREPEPAARDELQRVLIGQDVELVFGEVRPDCVTLVEGVPTAERLDSCRALTTVIVPWAGVPLKTREVLKARPHLELHNLHHNAGPAAEMGLTLLLAVAKSVIPRHAELRRGDWTNRAQMELAVGLAARHAVVWGFGEIGSRIARMCRGLGMRVTGVAREARDEVRGADALEELLPSADVLFICVPLTSETEGRLGARELSLLPRDAIVVNVARGAVIEERALFEALNEGRLFGAGLDVWWRYPDSQDERRLPSSCPFHELDNVVMSPHRGGHVAETEVLRMQALGNLLCAQAQGRPMPGRVDLSIGY